MWLKRGLRVGLAVVLSAVSTATGLIAAFLAAAAMGGAVPAERVERSVGALEHEIVLLEGLLHTDILLPATPQVRRAFAFARDTQLPIDAPGLRWLSVGWGSKAFYTTAGTYGDIELGTAWRAATGDSVVVRLVGFGPLADGADLRRLAIDEAGLDILIDRAVSSLRRTADGRPERVIGASLTPGDVFYEAQGRFSLLNPCNEWARQTLRAAGFGVGTWTPTTFALGASIEPLRR